MLFVQDVCVKEWVEGFKPLYTFCCCCLSVYFDNLFFLASPQGASCCSSDPNMLGEMMFGSVAMSYKGSTLKIHQIRLGKLLHENTSWGYKYRVILMWYCLPKKTLLTSLNYAGMPPPLSFFTYMLSFTLTFIFTLSCCFWVYVQIPPTADA